MQPITQRECGEYVVHDDRDVAQWSAFADAFDGACSDLFVRHAQLNVAAEERLQRLALWDAENEARHDISVSANEAFVVVWSAWKDEAAKRAYTQRLMESYYSTALSGSARRAEIEARRARLAQDEEA